MKMMMCANYLSGADHGTLEQGASLMTSNRLSSAMASQSRIKGITCFFFFLVFDLILLFSITTQLQ